MRHAHATIALVPGKGKIRRFNVPRIESWQIEQAIDNDADQFSLDIGDSMGQLLDGLDRDVEVRANVFATGLNGRVWQMFSGLADIDQLASTKTNSIQGRDVPSAILLDTDAEPNRWRGVTPKVFLTDRGKKLGLTDVSIAPMKEIGTLWTDATEKEWAFWWRIARMGGCYMWTRNTGRLMIDRLGYSISKFNYSFGHARRGEQASEWIRVVDVTATSTKQTRLGKVVVYGQDTKKAGNIRIGIARDESIAAWMRKPTTLLTSTTAKTQKDLDAEAGVEMFESKVGAQEYTLVVRDIAIPIEQNTMARVNLPEYGLVGHFFIVGVTRTGSADALIQTVRLRERGFAVSKRVPDAPVVQKTPDSARNKPTANIGGYLDQQGIPNGSSYVRAANEFGRANGWDLSYFLGVLLSISAQETGGSFANVRERGTTEWTPKPKQNIFSPPDNIFGGAPFTPGSGESVQAWKALFANDPGNPLNPLAPHDAGVGPMQLTTHGYKVWADEFGWDGVSKSDEYEGGRWNPDSNIRAGAKALYAKIQAVSADPTNPETIWAAVRAYNGSGDAAERYMQQVKKRFQQFYSDASAAIVETPSVVVGRAQRDLPLPNGDTLHLPDSTPDEVAKAITWAFSQLGQPYEYGGDGSNGRYDCASFVTKAITFGAPELRSVLNEPRPGNHGETTYTLWTPGRFRSVSKDALVPGDLVFFNGRSVTGELEPRGHVGMYVGDDLFIHDPHTNDFVKISGLGEDYYVENYNGARRIFTWKGLP